MTCLRIWQPDFASAVTQLCKNNLSIQVGLPARTELRELGTLWLVLTFIANK